MQYAAKVMQFAEELRGIPIESEYVRLLETAPSNLYENGAKSYEMFVKPARVDLLRVGAHYAISSLFSEYPGSTGIYCYTANREIYDRMEAGKLKLAIGRTHITSDVTWDEDTISFAVLHLGDHNINGGVREFRGEEAFSAMQEEIRSAFEKGDIPDVIRLMDKHFGTHNYSLRVLFKYEQKKILDQILQSTLEGIESSYRQIFENNYNIMNFFQDLGIPFPKPLFVTAEFILNTDLQRILEDEEPNPDRVANLITEAKNWSIDLDTSTLGFVASSRINSFMEKLSFQPEDISLMEKIENNLKLLGSLLLDLDLSKAQNIYFSMGKGLYNEMKEKKERDKLAQRWVEVFHRLGYYLRVKVS